VIPFPKPLLQTLDCRRHTYTLNPGPQVAQQFHRLYYMHVALSAWKAAHKQFQKARQVADQEVAQHALAAKVGAVKGREQELWYVLCTGQQLQV
jgi:hypothetical protein